MEYWANLNMPDPEFVELLNLCYEWTNGDAEYIYECTLKDDAPENVKKAFEKLKKLQKKIRRSGHLCLMFPLALFKSVHFSINAMWL